MGYVHGVNAHRPDGDPHPTAPETSSSGPGRVVLLTTSHRVAPGLLSWPAWQALHGADRVLCADEAHPQLPYLREAGVTDSEIRNAFADALAVPPSK